MAIRTKKLSTGEKLGLGAVAMVAGALLARALGGPKAGGAPASANDSKAPNLTNEVLEDLIRQIVDRLDESGHGKNWGMVALDALEQVVSGLLPRWAGKLFDIVYQVERDAIAGKIAKVSKKAAALHRARAHYMTRKGH